MQTTSIFLLIEDHHPKATGDLGATVICEETVVDLETQRRIRGSVLHLRGNSDQVNAYMAACAPIWCCTNSPMLGSWVKYEASDK